LSSSTSPGGLPDFTTAESSAGAADGAAADGGDPPVTPADGAVLTPTVIGLIAGGRVETQNCHNCASAVETAARNEREQGTALTSLRAVRVCERRSEAPTEVYGDQLLPGSRWCTR
jgi:hypothetical protein